MNTMQDFHDSLSSDKLQNTYLKILAQINKINRDQIKFLESDMGWQEWGEQNQMIATNQT